jgi:hypothetical protein
MLRPASGQPPTLELSLHAPAVNHQPEFAAYCVTPDADKALIDDALAMAWTCIDTATDEDMREKMNRAVPASGGDRPSAVTPRQVPA